MRLLRHGPRLESTWRHPGPRALLPSLRNRRCYASTTAHPQDIAVVGGGISGLSSAYYLAKEFPQSNITLYEAQNEVGGWIRSKQVRVPGGQVLFEEGPRSLRPNTVTSKATALLVCAFHVLSLCCSRS